MLDLLDTLYIVEQGADRGRGRMRSTLSFTVGRGVYKALTIVVIQALENVH